MTERRSPNFETAMGRVVSASSSIAFVAPATYSQDFSHFTQNHLKGSMGSIDDIHEQVVGLVDIRQILGNLQSAVQRMEMCLSHQMVAVEDVRFALGLGFLAAHAPLIRKCFLVSAAEIIPHQPPNETVSSKVQAPEIAKEPSEDPELIWADQIPLPMRLIFHGVLHLAQDLPATLPGVAPEVGGQSWALPAYAGSRSLVMKAESLEPSEPRKTPQPHTATPSWDFRAVALRVFTAPLTLLHRCLAQSNIHRRKSDSLAAVRAPWMQELQKLRRSRRLIARDTGCTRQRSPTSLERSPQNRWLAGLFDCTTGPGTCSALELLEGWSGQAFAQVFQDVSAARVGSIKSITDASQPFAKEAVPSSSAAVPPRQEEELDTVWDDGRAGGRDGPATPTAPAPESRCVAQVQAAFDLTGTTQSQEHGGNIGGEPVSIEIGTQSALTLSRIICKFSDSGEVDPGQLGGVGPLWVFACCQSWIIPGLRDSPWRMLKRCRRVSLEELQDNYDADRMQHPRVEISRDLASPALSEDDLFPSVSTALVGFARTRLVWTPAAKDFQEGLPWQVLSGFSILVPSFVSAGTVALNIMAGDDFRLNTSILCYVVGGLLATLSLRRAGITALLGPVERRFDEYAEEMGEVTAMYVFMVSCRVLASVITKDVTYGSAVGGGLATAFPGFTFSLIALTLSLICYCQLHVCCGLELAIDSFGLRISAAFWDDLRMGVDAEAYSELTFQGLFRDMNMEKALEEWNLVQATLRQVSGKISGSLFILGATCFATLMFVGRRFLAEQLLNNADLLRNLSTNLVDTCLWLGWLYPPILLFVYSMFRAAAVSEKASRVVNSWKFDPEDLGDAQWMDADRQYVVQYIIQSEAGFYMKGVRLTAGSVQKMRWQPDAKDIEALATPGSQVRSLSMRLHNARGDGDGCHALEFNQRSPWGLVQAACGTSSHQCALNAQGGGKWGLAAVVPPEDSEPGSDLLAAAHSAADAVSSGAASSAVTPGHLGDLFVANKASGQVKEPVAPPKPSEFYGDRRAEAWASYGIVVGTILCKIDKIDEKNTNRQWVEVKEEVALHSPRGRLEPEVKGPAGKKRAISAGAVTHGTGMNEKADNQRTFATVSYLWMTPEMKAFYDYTMGELDDEVTEYISCLYQALLVPLTKVAAYTGEALLSCALIWVMARGSQSGSDLFGLAKGVAAEVSKSGVESVSAGRGAGGVRDLFAPVRVPAAPAEDSEAGSDLLAAARTAADA
ncbi:unnamed protein product, partial [Symbiodinium microadriaticum]